MTDDLYHLSLIRHLAIVGFDMLDGLPRAADPAIEAALVRAVEALDDLRRISGDEIDRATAAAEAA